MVKTASTRFMGSDICASNSEMYGWHREPTAEELLGRNLEVFKSQSLTKKKKKTKIRRTARKFW